MEWEAFDADGGRYTSLDDLPEDGLVGVVEYLEPPYRVIVDGGNWYVWDGERWKASGDGSDDGRWGRRPRGDVVIRSAPSLDDDVWAAIKREMLEARVRPSERS